MLTEISGVEEPPTDFTDAHRWLGCVGFSYGIHRIHSKLGCVRGALGTAWVWQGCHTLLHMCKSVLSVGVPLLGLLVQQRLLHPLNICVDLCHLWEALLCKKILCVPCVLWEDTVCFVGAAETAAPPKLASVGGSSLQEDSVRSVRSVGGYRLLCWCSRDCCTPPLSLHLWEAISRMWVRGYGRMPYPPMTLRLAVLGDSLLDEHFELLAEFGVVLQQSLCSVATLRQFRAVVAVPRTRLLDDAVLYAEVYHLANL